MKSKNIFKRWLKDKLSLEYIGDLSYGRDDARVQSFGVKTNDALMGYDRTNR